MKWHLRYFNYISRAILVDRLYATKTQNAQDLIASLSATVDTWLALLASGEAVLM